MGEREGTEGIRMNGRKRKSRRKLRMKRKGIKKTYKERHREEDGVDRDEREEEEG